MAAKVGSFAVVCLLLSPYLLQLTGANPLARQDEEYGQTDRTICWNAIYGYKDEPATIQYSPSSCSDDGTSFGVYQMTSYGGHVCTDKVGKVVEEIGYAERVASYERTGSFDYDGTSYCTGVVERASSG